MKDNAKKEEKVYVSPVSRPVRLKKARAASAFVESLLLYFPDLKKRLVLAGMAETPAEFLEKVIFSSVFLSLVLTVLTGLLMNIARMNYLFALILLPMYLAGSFFYFMLYPEAKRIKRQRDIDAELVFAGRHLLIALRAGMPLFDSLVGVSEGYGSVSEEFRKIVEKINLGVPMGQAVREAGTNLPSDAFSRIMLQLANALSSGADVASALETVLNQISREQAISLKAYGQKLNPTLMFYMMFGIVFPSLGVAFAIILFSIVSGGSIGLNSTSLIYVALIIALVQFIFLSMLESARPNYLL